MLFILEVRGVVDIGGERGLLFLILEVSGLLLIVEVRVFFFVDIGGESGLLLILEVREGCC